MAIWNKYRVHRPISVGKLRSVDDRTFCFDGKHFSVSLRRGVGECIDIVRSTVILISHEVDAGEDIIDGLKREILEETGYEATDIQELGIVEEDRYYCGMHQTSYCFTAQANAFVATNYTEKERRQGMNLRWAKSIAEAITWIESGYQTDEDGSETGLSMMKLRDISICEAALKSV